MVYGTISQVSHSQKGEGEGRGEEQHIFNSIFIEFSSISLFSKDTLDNTE
jgi:hypothetical protein